MLLSCLLLCIFESRAPVVAACSLMCCFNFSLMCTILFSLSVFLLESRFLLLRLFFACLFPVIAATGITNVLSIALLTNTALF